MGKLTYILITLCVLFNISQCFTSRHSGLKYGNNDGCEKEFNEEECFIDLYCVSYVTDIDYIGSHEHDTCERGVYYNEERGGYFVPVLLHYRSSHSDEGIPRIHDFSYVTYMVIYLDLTFNNYTNLPTLTEMKALESLNVSHNNINTAKLSNVYNLESLIEIDFSFNKIDTINITHDEFVYRKLKKLWLSHNQLIDLPDAIFNNLSDLEFLDLSYNFINTLTLTAFVGLKELKVLKLSHNKIYELNYSLFCLNSLRELYLDDNKIVSILVHDFERLSNLKILDLRKNLIQGLDKNLFNNLTLVKEIDLSDNLLTAIDKATFSTTFNLQSINLSNNKLTEIPIRLFQAKNISFFSIEKNNLQGSLKRGTFDGLQLNTKLDMSYQSISTIEDYAFYGLDNLIELLLNNNKIHTLSNKCFKTLQKLVHLDLSSNVITQIDFDKENLLSLRSLIFHNNHITQIKKDNFEQLQLLQFLDLSQNNISNIESQSFKTLAYLNSLLIDKNPLMGNLQSNTFEGLSEVPKLELSYTLLNVIANASFYDMINLNDLNISHSKVCELQYNTFSNTGKIDVLDLSYNMIKYFSVNVTDLKSLKKLLLNNNRLTVLYSNTFKGMSALNQIILSNNLITSADIDTFKNQANLHYLDLSNNTNIKLNFSVINEMKLLETLLLSNSISNITFEDFDELPLSKLEISNSNIQNIGKLHLSKLKKIQSLCLSKNNVKQLVVGEFSDMDEIVEIDVSYNKIDSIQPGVFKDNHMLDKLNVSHNALLAINYGVLNGLVHLKVLDISFNYIDSLETERFYRVPALEELIADHNRITDVSIEDFLGTNIKKLSIGDNPLSCEVVTKLKMASDPSFIITALRHIEEKEENIDGITCNYHHDEFFFNTKINEKQKSKDYNENTLIQIRDILLKLNSGKIQNEERFIHNENLHNFTEILQRLHMDYTDNWSQLNNETLGLSEEQKTTNKLLERILKDMDNAMVLNREKILAEVESKIASGISKHIETVPTMTSSLSMHKNEKFTLNNDPKSSVFVETCIAFILLILEID
ncbi:chaoptin-like [Melitaea cinxia]|uniref:chaoptin-like n=1 Tax=Melitaea cinxia TaxID=113334 RepID=UPI001E26EFFD|nr:chaoptin-like [Melitaea cinxia]